MDSSSGSLVTRPLSPGGDNAEGTLRLRVEPSKGEPFTHICTGPSTLLGRSSECDVVLADRSSSRRHSRIFREEGEWFVEDLGSRNTTLVNGKPIAGAVRIGNGDVVQIAESRIVVEPQQVVKTPDWDSAVFLPAAALAASLMMETPSLEGSGSEELRRQAERLKALNDVHRALAASITVDQLLELILDRAFALLRPEEGVIYLKRADGTLDRAAERRLPGAPAAAFSSRRLAAEVIDKGLAALTLDASTDERFSDAPSIMTSGVRSLVAAPLLHGDTCPGMLVLVSRLRRREFSEEDLALLVSLGSIAGLRIRNIALAEDAARRLVLEKELDLARTIQLGLLPSELPAVPGHTLVAESYASRTVSGDLYAVRERDGGEVVLLVADVSGKGMAASLLTASLEALATGPIEVGLPADEICLKLSRRLFARTPPERFATAFLGVLHAETGRLTYANAGHNAPIRIRASGQIDSLGATGPPLGLLSAATYAAREILLEPGDTLLVYTDGITEAVNREDEEYGLERLHEICMASCGASIEDFRRTLHADLERFVQGLPFADDRTLLLLRRQP
ncbi:MAG: SpoIIE family protein phosphatase [Thermoanaerobaculia bacterium]